MVEGQQQHGGRKEESRTSRAPADGVRGGGVRADAGRGRGAAAGDGGDGRGGEEGGRRG